MTSSLTLNVIDDLDGQANEISIGEQFQIEFNFTGPAGEAPISGYADFNFDPNFIQVDSIDYSEAYTELQNDNINNTSGLVDEVGATYDVVSFLTDPTNFPPPAPLVFTLNLTALDAVDSTQVTTDPGEDPSSVITFGGLDGDQSGSTTFGSLNLTIECFLTGTLIATDQGERPVETLKIGDQVQTADGNLERIKWVGHQTAEPSQVSQPLRGYPIQIKAGALGNNRPHRDLYVSPDHALLLEGLLINAGALVNGTSILRTEPTETFVYHHIELENHALLIAEGAWAESYLPQKEDRMIYDNGAEYEELYPHGSKLMLWPMDYPRVSSQNKLPRFIRKYLNQIAQELGLTAQIA